MDQAKLKQIWEDPDSTIPIAGYHPKTATDFIPTPVYKEGFPGSDSKMASVPTASRFYMDKGKQEEGEPPRMPGQPADNSIAFLMGAGSAAAILLVIFLLYRSQ